MPEPQDPELTSLRGVAETAWNLGLLTGLVSGFAIGVLAMCAVVWILMP